MSCACGASRCCARHERMLDELIAKRPTSVVRLIKASLNVVEAKDALNDAARGSFTSTRDPIEVQNEMMQLTAKLTNADEELRSALEELKVREVSGG